MPLHALCSTTSAVRVRPAKVVSSWSSTATVPAEVWEAMHTHLSRQGQIKWQSDQYGLVVDIEGVKNMGLQADETPDPSDCSHGGAVFVRDADTLASMYTNSNGPGTVAAVMGLYNRGKVRHYTAAVV